MVGLGSRHIVDSSAYHSIDGFYGFQTMMRGDRVVFFYERLEKRILAEEASSSCYEDNGYKQKLFKTYCLGFLCLGKQSLQ